jgi:hypothetical protein
MVYIPFLTPLFTPHHTPNHKPHHYLPKPKMPNTPCSPLPYGHGPKPQIDTPLGFLTAPIFLSYAKSSSTPPGYDLVYSNAHSSSTSTSYLGYTELPIYSPQTCSRRCDATTGCKAFNIFFERTPTLKVGEQCRNSLSSTTIKCALWGEELGEGDGKNKGYRTWDFQVVVAGSNAYNKNGEAVPVRSEGVPSVPRLEGIGMRAVVVGMLAAGVVSMM